jgi:hypothetical protein
VLYLKLKQYLPTERAALAAMNTFAAFNGVISPRKTRRDDGSALIRYVVLIPAGRRPTAVVKQLGLQAPHTEWSLVEVDADGFESEVAPEPRA